MFKPVAFCVSKNSIPNVKFYSEKIKRFESNTTNGYYVSIWYIGNISESNNFKYQFSFPATDSLLDRNLVINIKSNTITIENDWLGSIPVFYNRKELIVSSIPSLCIKDKAIDKDGLINYFRFGYSVFEKTPFESVKFLRYYSKISLTKHAFELSYKEDPIVNYDFRERETKPLDVISAIKDYIYNCEQQTNGPIVIPTSGGFDSRLLNWAINDRSRIFSYTYGTSTNQANSKEVVYAQKISEILKTNWEQIKLNNFHCFIDDWHRLFGYSTHLHGMYHIEFYKKIYKKISFFENSSLLSGIYGDLWAGSISRKTIYSPLDIIKLGHTHALTLNDRFFDKDYSSPTLNDFFNSNMKLLDSHFYQLITTVRIKMILLSYLMSVPEYYGIPAWTPFLNLDVTSKMLSINENLRNKRQWQNRFFCEIGLGVEKMNLSYSTTNSLNYEMARKFSFEKIDEKILNEAVKVHKIKALNKRINSFTALVEIIEFAMINLKLRGILRRMGVKRAGYLNHLNSYYVLKAIDKALK